MLGEESQQNYKSTLPGPAEKIPYHQALELSGAGTTQAGMVLIPLRITTKHGSNRLQTAELTHSSSTQVRIRGELSSTGADLAQAADLALCLTRKNISRQRSACICRQTIRASRGFQSLVAWCCAM